MDGSAQDIQIRGNIFRGGRYGVNLNLPESHRSRRLLIANNTFLDTIFWVGLWATDPRQDQFEISNNLILGAHKVHWDRVDQPSQAAGRWVFRANWWESSPETEGLAGLGGRIALIKPSIPLLSRDPKNPNFLRPSPDSPLAKQGVGGHLPSHIGALPPPERAPRATTLSASNRRQALNE